MSKLHYKPLMLLLPLILILGLFYVLDNPNREIKEMNQRVELSNETKVNMTAESKSNEYIFIVGQTGSLQGGYEPIYDEPDINSEEIAHLQYNCVVLADPKQEYDEWVYVDLCEKGKGYVQKKNVIIDNINLTINDALRNELVNNALKYLGLRFVVHGTSLQTGLDCTNFVSQIYGLSGLQIPNTTSGINEFGYKIDESEILPGDIIYYDKANDGSGHVGMYIGGGYIINSAGHSGRTYPEGGVRICCLTYKDRDHYYPLRLITMKYGDDNEQ